MPRAAAHRDCAAQHNMVHCSNHRLTLAFGGKSELEFRTFTTSQKVCGTCSPRLFR